MLKPVTTKKARNRATWNHPRPTSAMYNGTAVRVTRRVVKRKMAFGQLTRFQQKLCINYTWMTCQPKDALAGMEILRRFIGCFKEILILLLDVTGGDR